MDPQLKENVTARSTWTRGAFTLLFVIIYYFAFFLVLGIVLFQFVLTLLTGKNNDQLLRFGQSLAAFIQQALLYITYNSEEKPFPFGPWPEERGSALSTTGKKKTTKKAAKKSTGDNKENPDTSEDKN